MPVALSRCVTKIDSLPLARLDRVAQGRPQRARLRHDAKRFADEMQRVDSPRSGLELPLAAATAPRPKTTLPEPASEGDTQPTSNESQPTADPLISVKVALPQSPELGKSIPAPVESTTSQLPTATGPTAEDHRKIGTFHPREVLDAPPLLETLSDQAALKRCVATEESTQQMPTPATTRVATAASGSDQPDSSPTDRGGRSQQEPQTSGERSSPQTAAATAPEQQAGESAASAPSPNATATSPTVAAPPLAATTASPLGSVATTTPSSPHAPLVDQVMAKLEQVPPHGVVLVTLDPPELGPVVVRFTRRGEQLDVRLQAEQEATTQLLIHDLARLESALSRLRDLPAVHVRIEGSGGGAADAATGFDAGTTTTRDRRQSAAERESGAARHEITTMRRTRDRRRSASRLDVWS